MRAALGAVLRIARRRMPLIIVAVAPVVALVGASSASAAYAKFVQCPATTPGVRICTFGETTSGEVAIGSTKVPITKTIVQQGGGIPTGNPGEYFLLPAKNGESLSKTEENVPGGLLDLVNCQEIKGNGIFELIERGACEAIFENKTTGVTAVTELVANEHNPAILDIPNTVEEKGTALVLPVRVHLKNPLLGEGCYIGSEASPIELRLTTGTTSPPAPNKPISGQTGNIEEPEEGVLQLANNWLVDNSFSVPVAEGCGGFFSFLIDPIVDSKLGLPSAAGHNTAILKGSLDTVNAKKVAEAG